MIWRVGMRCVHVRTPEGEPSIHAGNVGTIAEVFAERSEWLECENGPTDRGFFAFNCRVRWDDDPGTTWCQHTDQLEPLRRTDNEVGSWDEMNFHPSDFLKETA